MQARSIATGAFKILAAGSAEQWLEAACPAPGEDAGEWYVFARPDAVLHPQLAALLRAHGAQRPDIDIFYGDEVIAAQPGRAAQYLCKPSFDRTQLMAQDYIGLPFAVRGSVLAALGPPDAKTRSAQCYDLVLRAISADIGIERITEVFAFHPARRLWASREDRLSVVERFLARDDPACYAVPGLTEASLEVRRRFDVHPEVTLVLPTCQAHRPAIHAAPGGRPMIGDLLDSLCLSDWPMDRLVVLVGDDLEDASIYESRPWPFRLERVVTARRAPGEFNYASKINMLSRAVATEHMIILNDDLLIRAPGWIKALMTFAADEGVGGVGARLLYPDGGIQHAGMAAGIMGHCSHVFIGWPAEDPTYQDWAAVQRECSMLTGAVFATRRSVLAQVNGFDERFSLDFNDVDLCLRLRQLGYRIVYTPHAELTHFESASRGERGTPADQTALFMEKWQDYIKDDPAYHPNLTRTTPDVHPVIPAKAWWTSVGKA